MAIYKGSTLLTSAGEARLPNYTTTQRDALSASGGDVIWNTTDGQAQFYDGTDWAELDITLIQPVQYLVVAGGGGGGGSRGGGGGAGGLLTGTINLSDGAHAIVVGAGGAGGINYTGDASPGNSSSINDDIINAVGGGRAGKYNGSLSRDGGSGGGGAFDIDGGSATSGQGNDGGDYDESGGSLRRQGAGGGGAGEVGGNPTGNAKSVTLSFSGKGGNGLTSDIISSANATTAGIGHVISSEVWFAGGGAGAGRECAQRGHGKGSGNIQTNDTTTNGNGLAAANNTGGGGGGARNATSDSLNRTGGAGGSGVIILRFPSTRSYTLGSGLSSSNQHNAFTEGSDTVLVLKGTGDITFS